MCDKEDYPVAKISLAETYLLVEELKDDIKNLFREVDNLAYYIPMKQAIIENPALDDFKERNLDSTLENLHRILEKRKERQARKSRFFMNFKSDN